MSNFLFAFLLTLLAGLSTLIGGLIAFLPKKPNGNFLCVSLGFSAGVMIYVSLVEIFFKSRESLSNETGPFLGLLFSSLAFFCGIILIFLIDKFIPSKPQNLNEDKSKNLLKTGTIVAIAITIHNFPEGLATFISALKEPSIALPIFAAIAIHNIPEGIAVAVPILKASGSKKESFLFCLLSGLAEPLGAIIGYLLLLPIMSDLLLGIIFGVVAGIMVYISFDELLPSSREYGSHSLSMLGLFLGMLTMATSLILFA